MKRLFPLILIVFLGMYLRFDRLTTIPPSLSHDETAIAYNAYSVLKTGKDEYSEAYPLLFRSFDDYKLPGMVYSTVPFVALFGRSELAARLPSAIYGTLSIIVMYFFALELFSKASNLKQQAPNKSQAPSTKRLKFWNFGFVWDSGLGTWNLPKTAALLCSLFLAIQPWHINFSRQLFESNGAVFWYLLGTYFLLRSRRNYKEIVWAGLSYVIAFYFYYSVRLVIPFVAFLYLILYWKTVTRQWKTTVFALTICVFTFLPLGKEMFSPGGLERISIVSVVNDPNYIKRRDAYVKNMGANPTVVTKLIYNRRVALVQTAIENYAKNISPHNLFVTGTGTYGALYPFEGVFIIFGIFALFALPRFPMLITLVWLFSAFLPGALSINQPNTLRTLIAAPAFAVLSGLGAIELIRLIRKQSFDRIIVFYIAVLFFTWAAHELPKFRYAYFVDNPSNNAVAFGDGYKQMVEYVNAHEREYDQLYISGYYWRPYIFLLYWGNVDPSTYQRSGSREQFGKYIFTAASWDTNGIKLMDPGFNPGTLQTPGKTLFLLAPNELEVQKKHFQPIQDINGRHAQRVFVAAEEQ